MKIEYHNLYVHIILTTKNRIPFIREEFRDRLEKFITGVVLNHRSRLYSIYANPDHLHMLISRSPQVTETDLTFRIARASEKFIRENKLCEEFSWQESAAAFSVSKGHVDNVCKYILNQKEHHKKVSYADEYNRLIRHYQQTLRWDQAA